MNVYATCYASEDSLVSGDSEGSEVSISEVVAVTSEGGSGAEGSACDSP